MAGQLTEQMKEHAWLVLTED